MTWKEAIVYILQNNKLNVQGHKTSDASSDPLIKNFGMYWIRDGVNWKHNPKLLGSQSDGAQPIDSIYSEKCLYTFCWVT